jgi:curved DNA-binding protein CbpA
MGNETSNLVNNSEEENLKLLQQQILNNQLEIQRMQLNNLQNGQSSNQYNNVNQRQNPRQNQRQNPNQNPNQYNNPNQNPNQSGNNSMGNNPIFTNSALQREISKSPGMKRQLLTQILQQYQHQMSQQQIAKVNQMLRETMIQNEREQQLHQLTNIGTTSQVPNERQLMRQQQVNDVSTLSSNYQTSAQKEAAEFKLAQKRREAEFKDKQRQRRHQYEANLEQLQKDKIDSLRLFNLNNNYTFDELKKSYRTLAIKTHPDRPHGSKEKFQLVTKCYLYLVEKLKKEASDKQHGQLKDGSRDYWKSQVSPQNKAHMQKGQRQAKDNFNVTMFNKIFEENKIYDPNEEGYENWFKDDSPENKPSQPVFSNKFNIDVFNRTFDGYKGDENNSQIMEYKEPQAIQSCDKMGYSELGSNKANFTKTGASQGQDLKYSDLKSAYTKGDLINPNQVKYKTYRNINELEKDRSNLSYEMSPEDSERRAVQSQIEQEEEEERQARLRNNDALSAEHYNKVHQRMLGYSSQPDLNR